MRNLLYAGLVGPLLFIVVFLVEGFTRPGYSQWRHYVSQLATGPGGGVQVANFLVCGALVLAFVVALRRVTGSIAAPILLGLFAIGLLVAGVFSTDPALGYPPGAAPNPTAHGAIHGFAGLACFSLLPATAFVMSSWFARHGLKRWMWYSLAVGVVMIITFIASTTASAMDAAGTLPNAPTGFFQRIAIITGWTWMAMVALHFIRATSLDSRTA